MLTIVLSACLSTNPASCELQDLGMIRTEGSKSCHLLIEPAVKAWQLAHPDLILQSAYCLPRRPLQGR